MRRTYVKSKFVPPQARPLSYSGRTGGRKEGKGRQSCSSIKVEGGVPPAKDPGGFMKGIRNKGAE